MIELNITNFITIGLIAMIFHAIFMFGRKALGGKSTKTAAS